jgi:hypothetical protein
MGNHSSDPAQVEIKFIFGDAEITKALTAFHLDGTGLLRTVTFFDTSDRQLFRGHSTRNDVKVILRARFNDGKKNGKTTVKIRTTEKLDAALQSDDSVGAKREFDFAFGKNLLDSYSLDHEEEATEISAVLTRQRSVKKVFNHLQQSLVESVAGKDFGWSDLRIFGPVSRIQVWEHISLAGINLPATVELWQLPASEPGEESRILELSVRTELEEQTPTVDRLLEFLKKSGLTPSTTETKTQIVLEHFSPGTIAK